jgi:hypothetical protein
VNSHDSLLEKTYGNLEGLLGERLEGERRSQGFSKDEMIAVARLWRIFNQLPGGGPSKFHDAG